MKIMVVTPYYAPYVGGLENYARNVIRGLRVDGHEVVVVTSGGQVRRRSHDVVDGVRVVRLPVWLTVSNTPVNPLWFVQLPALIERERPDVVLAHTPVPFVADVAARAAGQRHLVVTYHNDLAKEGVIQRAIVAAYWRLLGRGTLERADRIITTSQFYAESSPFLAPYANKIDVIAPGVDTDRFHPDVDPGPVRSRFPDQKVILFVSSLARSHAHKGLGLLLEATKALRRDDEQVRLLVVGRGDGRADYEKQARDLGIGDAVSFEGFVSEQELPGYYSAADVFILPSTTMSEGFGMVLLEAAACGTPVVGTDVGGIPAALHAVGSPYLAEPTLDSVVRVLREVLGGRPPGPAPVGPRSVSWQDAAALTARTLESARRPRVTLIHNVISPYRQAMFDDLADAVNLRVLFSQAAGRGRLWRGELGSHRFDARKLPSVPIGPVVYNPGGFRRLRRSRFDVLITNTDPDTAPLSLSGLVLARLRRRPMLVWSEVTDDVVRSFPALVPTGDRPASALLKALNAVVMAYRRLFLTASAGSLAFSSAAGDFLMANGVGDRDIHRTFEVVPPEMLPEPSPGCRRDGRTFVYVGYLNQRKNVMLLIRAFRELAQPGVRLLIAGSGPEETRLRAAARGDARIAFLGYLDGQAKADLYATGDVLVLPTRHDCWGLVVNEAMHYGLAIIVTDAAAASELVDETRGIVVASQDREALTAAMDRLVREPRLLTAMQQRNRASKDVCDVSKAVEAFRRAIAQVVP